MLCDPQYRCMNYIMEEIRQWIILLILSHWSNYKKSVNYSNTALTSLMLQENYQMNILECLQPSGVVPARGSTAVQFVFAPQEVKYYIVRMLYCSV